LLDSFENSEGKLNLVLEYSAGGTLIDFLNKHRKVETLDMFDYPNSWTTTYPISRDLAIRIMSELVHGLKKIHGAGVIHKDIHDGNILFMGDPETWDLHGDDPFVKFADY
jgi:serine/threonine protein kinase